MNACHKADHAIIADLRDSVDSVREFAWGLGASTATRQQILDALTRKPFAPASETMDEILDHWAADDEDES